MGRQRYSVATKKKCDHDSSGLVGHVYAPPPSVLSQAAQHALASSRTRRM